MWSLCRGARRLGASRGAVHGAGRVQGEACIEERGQAKSARCLLTNAGLDDAQGRR